MTYSWLFKFSLTMHFKTRCSYRNTWPHLRKMPKQNLKRNDSLTINWKKNVIDSEPEWLKYSSCLEIRWSWSLRCRLRIAGFHLLVIFPDFAFHLLSLIHWCCAGKARSHFWLVFMIQTLNCFNMVLEMAHYFTNLQVNLFSKQ